MADKETKQKPTASKTSAEAAKSSSKSVAAKPAEAKEGKQKPVSASKSAETKAKSPAAKFAERNAVTSAKSAEVKKEDAGTKAAESKTKKTAEPTAASVVNKYSNSRGKQTTVVEDVKKRKAEAKGKTSVYSEVKPVEANVKPAEEKPTAASVVDKHSNSRGKQTGLVDDIKKRKADEREQTRAKAKDNRAARAASAANGETAAVRFDAKTQNIILWVLIGILIASLLAGLILTTISAVTNSNTPFVYAYKSAQAVGFYSKQLGTTDRYKPVEGIRDEGLAEYPVYGKTLSSVIGMDNDKVAARNALIYESSYLTATGTWNGGAGQYTWMDKDGFLYSGSTAEPVKTVDSKGNHRQLYKHTASVGLYGGDVDDNEPGIIKQLTLRPRGYTRGYNVTGVYAPAGEVVKIEISAKDMNATGGIVVHIGQALYNGKANNIWTAKNQMQRFPVILNTMTVDKNTSTYNEETDTYTAYVGNFVGGPVYIRNESVTFNVTISGGVAYSHFILGYTTPEEFAQNAKSSAPYFDLEVWSYGVLHSGPKSQAKSFSYDDLYKVAVLWEKVSLVSTTNSLQGIVFLYDPFVAAGAAVAFPGQGSVNCPTGWMRNALDYKGIVANGGWGNFHEYHHNFQGYGVGAGGEVTNNGMTLVSYSLFTKISSSRGLSNYGAGSLGGWNRYTSATWSLEQTLKIARSGEAPENGNRGLALYSTLLHNFGPDNYIQAKVRQQKSGYGQSYAGYLQAWQDVTHYDMSYYFNDILGAGLGNSYSNPDYPMFVPVSSVYQTGRGIKNVSGDTEYIQTMQPYVIPYGDDFTIDLRQYSAPGGQYAEGSIILPEGFKYVVKSVSQPESGIIVDNGDGTYKFTPGKEMKSGKIIVTLGLTKNDNAFDVDDVELVFEFEQTHEKNKLVLDRTTYTYSGDKMYTDAVQAYNNNFEGYQTAETKHHSNPTQNANTDVWFAPNTQEGHDKFPNATEDHFVKDNTIVVISGKLFADTDGKYRIYLRGRMNGAVFYSIDGGKTYQLGASIKDENVPQNSAQFRPKDPDTYFDLELKKDSWVYFKEVLIVQSSPIISYIGLGMKQWEEPRFTIQTTTDENGNEVTKYYNHLGVEVSEAEANNTDPIPPEFSSKNQPYVNAFRDSYEFSTGEFTTDYFYVREYSYNYKDNELQSDEQQLKSTNYSAAGSYNINNFPTENLADGKKDTYIHTNRGLGASVEKPLQIVMDMGEAKPVNRMIIYTQYRPNGDYHTAKNFKLEGSVDGELYTVIDEFENVPRSGTATTVNFEETTIRYYRLTITASTGSYIIIGEIEMWKIFEVNGAELLSPFEEQFKFYGKWDLEQASSNFGQVFVGSRGASVKFEFEGTRLGILASKQYASNLEVIIDGKVVGSISELKPLADQTSDIGLAYLSQELQAGKHTVVIKCKGKSCIDSFAIFPNPAETEN